MKRRNIVCFLLCVVFLLSACSSEKPPKVSDEAKKKKDNIMDSGPVRGGSLRLFSTTPDTLNPLLTNNVYVKDFLTLIYEGLFSVDERLNVNPKLAQRWVVSEDGLIWTLFLRRDTTWHDSVPFTAEDVEFTFNNILKQDERSIYSKNLENVASFASVDRYTFKIILKSRDSFTLEKLIFPILPKHYFEGEDILNTIKNMNPVGTGPFKFESYVQNEEVKLIAYNKWWGGKNTNPKLPNTPYILEVQIKIYKDSKEALNAFQTVDIDVAGITGVDLAKYNGRIDLLMKKFCSKNYEFLSFNMDKPTLQDKTVRQAIAYSIDKQKLINEVVPGQAVSADIPVFPGTWIYDAASIDPENNKETAKEILAKGGWKIGSNGYYKYSTLNLELLVNDDNETRLKVAKYITEQLNSIGINVHLKKTDFDTAKRLIASRHFDIALVGGYIPAIPDIGYMYASWNKRPIGDNIYNLSNYSNPELDVLLSQLVAENDITKKKNIFNNIKDIITEDMPYIGLYFKNEAIVYNKRVRGVENPNIFDRYNSITKWYLP